MASVLLLCLLNILCIYAFTKKYRSLNLNFDQNVSVVGIDPISSDLESQITSSCQQYDCGPDGAMHILEYVSSEIQEKLGRDLLLSYDRHLRTTLDVQWLEVADFFAQSRYDSHHFDVLNINAGNLFQFSNTCNDFDNLHKGECLFAKTMAPMVSQIGAIRDLSTAQLDLLLDASEQLFNIQLYEHSEALCYLLLRECPLISIERLGLQRGTPLMERSSLSFARYIRVAFILSEISKMKGLMSEATIFFQLALLCFELTSRHSSDLLLADQHLSYLIRLRLLLAVPSMPVDSSTSARHRADMVEDLLSLADEVARSGVSIPLLKLLSVLPSVNFHLSHQGLNDRPIQEALAVATTALCPDVSFSAPGLSSKKVLLSGGEGHPRVLKIAFLSSYFTDHSIGRILIDMLLVMKDVQFKVDGRLYSVQLLVYYLDRHTHVVSSGDSIRLERESTSDPVTQAFERHFGGNFRRLPHQDLDVSRRLISAEGLDFLFYSDVGMDFNSNILAYSRLAVYQAAWWGHPITTGLESIDYFISLDEEVPDADQHYSEQLVRLSSINTVPMKPIDQVAVRSRIRYDLLPAGLTPHSRIALVIGRLFKIHPDFLAMVARLLVAMSSDDHSVLVFIAEKLSEYNAVVWSQLKSLLEGMGLSEAEVYSLLRRVKFVSHSQHYEVMLSTARVVLDTFPYGGCLTAHDALVNGVPLVTLPAEFIRGRFTLSLYHQLNHTDLIASSPQHYVDLVLRLLADDAYHAQQRDLIHEKVRSSLHRSRQVAHEWMEFVLKLFV